MSISEGYKVSFIDFDEVVAHGQSKQEAISNASMSLLKILALAAQSGRRIPGPGQLGRIDESVVLINPLM